MPDDDDLMPRVERRRGGWFVIDVEASGPWSIKEAAEAAMKEDYDLANELHNEGRGFAR